MISNVITPIRLKESSRAQPNHHALLSFAVEEKGEKRFIQINIYLNNRFLYDNSMI
jgi:hypothetical protein